MSDYRRLISYIYAYEGGIKGKNIGYAKVEIRGGQCRIQVNVKRVFVGSNETGVYLLGSRSGNSSWENFYSGRRRGVSNTGKCRKCGGERDFRRSVLWADHP